jgi:alpha-L-arabinofuranosidase
MARLPWEHHLSVLNAARKVLIWLISVRNAGRYFLRHQSKVTFRTGVQVAGTVNWNKGTPDPKLGPRVRMYKFKRPVLFTQALLCFIFCTSSFAETHWWSDEDPSNHLWSTPNNWWQLSVPTNQEIAYVSIPNKPCLVDSTVTAICAELGVGHSGGPAYLDIAGGSITVGGLFRIGMNAAGNGTVHLYGGTIKCRNFAMRESGGTGSMDITEGTLVVAGNLLSKIQTYIDSGWITAYDGNGLVVADYNETNVGKTTLIATSDINHIGADFDDDGITSFKDYAIFAAAWLTSYGDSGFNDICDFSDDNIINALDLRFFAEDWLRWPAEEVQITVDANAIGHQISSYLTGVNIVYCYEDDYIWADGRLVNYLRDVKAGFCRYPGGGVTSFMHWQTPVARGWVDCWDPAFDGNYGNPQDFMSFEEYINICQQVGCKPMIGINMQSGVLYNRINDSIAEAVAWVQYCKDHNYNVKYYYMDGEIYHQTQRAPLTASQYAGYINQFVPAMKAVDPNIKIIANWKSGFYDTAVMNQWLTLLDMAGDNIDIADVHWYWDWGQGSWDKWVNQNPMRWENQWYTNGHSFVDEIAKFRTVINPSHPKIKLVSHEWNVAPYDTGFLSPFQCALMQSEMLSQFIEGDLFMANFWTMQAPDADWLNRLFLNTVTFEPNPIYEVFKMYSNVLGQKLIAAETSRVNVRPVAALDNDGNTLWVYLLHKSGEGQKITAKLDINGFAPTKAEALAFTAPNLYSNEAQLKQRTILFDNQTSQWTLALPPHSLTKVTFQKEN